MTHLNLMTLDITNICIYTQKSLLLTEFSIERILHFPQGEYLTEIYGEKCDFGAYVCPFMQIIHQGLYVF